MAKKQSGKVNVSTKQTSTKSGVKLIYKDWQIHPHIAEMGQFRTSRDAIWQRMTTKHEGNVLYHKLWNFWVRAGADAEPNPATYFRNPDEANSDTDLLLHDIGFTWTKAETEEEIWNRIGLLWNWYRSNVHVNDAEYQTISSVPDEWPSIADYARYYEIHHCLVRSACFSTAHVFATLLGRLVYPSYRFAIAEAHHCENGAPPTATHVFVAAYVSDRWFYLDPTAIYTQFPDYAHRQSIGVSSFATVDYEHPYRLIPIRRFGIDKVPYLPS